MRSLILFITLGLAPGLSADIYRSVDEDGNVVFSDTPSEGAEKIEQQEVQTIESPEVPRSGTQSRQRRGETGTGMTYRRLAITHPEPDQAVRQNAGNITVQVAVEPPLRPADRLVLMLDGREVAGGRSTSMGLESLDRGTHTLQVRVESADGTVRKRSEPVTFHLMRHSKLNAPPSTGPLNPPGGPVSNPGASNSP